MACRNCVDICNCSVGPADASITVSGSGTATDPYLVSSVAGLNAAWTSYTPTFTNVTTTSGTILGYYHRTGRVIDWWVKFTLGASSAITGLIGISLPVTAATNFVNQTEDALISDTGTKLYKVTGVYTTTTRLDLYATAYDPTLGAVNYTYLTATSSAIPQAAWASTDFFTVHGTYEAAS